MTATHTRHCTRLCNAAAAQEDGPVCHADKVGNSFESSQRLACREFQAFDSEHGCVLNNSYLIFGSAFQLAICSLLTIAGVFLHRRRDLCSITQDGSDLILHFCNLQLEPDRLGDKGAIPLRLEDSGHDMLGPGRLLTCQLLGSGRAQLHLDEDVPAVLNIQEIQCDGSAVFGLGWEVRHITLSKVPLGLWLIWHSVLASVILASWAAQGATLRTTLACTLVVTLLTVAVVQALRLAWRCPPEVRQRCRAKLLEELPRRAALSAALWAADKTKECESRADLMALGWSGEQLEDYTRTTLQRQSNEAGICVAYLTSDRFADLVQARGASKASTFRQLKEVFYFGDNPIGKNVICPRDGRMGASFVDSGTLPRESRAPCTHYLSWSWQYEVQVITDALEHWVESEKLDASDVYLYMCFFVNNQFRILYEAGGAGSDNLEDVFEKRLRHVGHVVAVLDAWEEPAYLTRVWTIFEQYTAIKLHVPVTRLGCC
ncbi:unnamed protein product [Symbiodinium sp. CCMP2456]|nr:unnamed protein product [Symbiodinium sp. CCMP2456]